MDFDAFFAQACPGRTPYPYQRRFATELDLPHLVRAPTSAGKTANAILGHLWRFLHSGRPTPRRLVYCLPMRVLVEQSMREAKTWKLHVNATIWHVRSPFGSSRDEVPLTWPADFS